MKLFEPASLGPCQCNEGFRDASEGQRFVLTTNSASQKPHNYARARSPTNTRCRPATSAVNKRLTAPNHALNQRERRSIRRPR